MILLDSDHVSVLVDMRDARHANLAERLLKVREPIAIPVVVLEEHLRGSLAQLHRVRDPLKLVDPYKRLVELLSFFAEWEISPWTTAAALRPTNSPACGLCEFVLGPMICESPPLPWSAMPCSCRRTCVISNRFPNCTWKTGFVRELGRKPQHSTIGWLSPNAVKNCRANI